MNLRKFQNKKIKNFLDITAILLCGFFVTALLINYESSNSFIGMDSYYYGLMYKSSNLSLLPEGIERGSLPQYPFYFFELVGKLSRILGIVGLGNIQEFAAFVAGCLSAFISMILTRNFLSRMTSRLAGFYMFILILINSKISLIWPGINNDVIMQKPHELFVGITIIPLNFLFLVYKR